MGHVIDAIVGRTPIVEETVRKYGLAVVFENEYAIIFLDPYHIDYWSDYLQLNIESKSEKVNWDCDLVLFWAKELGLSKFAIINTDYFGGIGVQGACVYNGDIKIMADGSINRALEELGVRYNGKTDPFDVLQLYKYRNTEDYYSETFNRAIGKENMIPGKPYGR